MGKNSPSTHTQTHHSIFKLEVFPDSPVSVSLQPAPMHIPISCSKKRAPRTDPRPHSELETDRKGSYAQAS